ncbi:MAG: ribosome biogenesis GTP-binding protein YihA/YsxC [Chthoniobacteraceae bacterium]
MMIIHSSALLGSAPDLASCPPSDLPEFAFIGRSNVGKSSLVNMITRVQGLAKVSDTPGKTRLINFFIVNKSWTLVDLPGYGYAKVGKKDRANFSSFVADYLQNRPNLLGTFVLIDSRLTPQKLDLDFLHWMVNCGLPFILIFTKTDKLSRAAAQANIDAFLLRLQEISPDAPAVLASSSKLSHGRTEILELIESSLAEAPEDREAGEAIA